MIVRVKMKWRSCRGGMSRIVALLLVLIAAMLVVIALPSWKDFRVRAEKVACEQALESARDGLIIDYLNNNEAGTAQDAMATLDEVLPARANICPAGGTIYLVRNGKGIFEPICGLHDSDERKRCRLNASRALELAQEALEEAYKTSEEIPSELEITLNGKPLTCVRVHEALNLRRGTSSTNGYDGIVAFYGIAGQDEFDTQFAKAGDICYFIYADEFRCAAWKAKDDWTGDAYQ